MAPITIGARGPGEDGDAVAALAACHGRIRSFAATARRLAEADASVPASEIAAAAQAVHRYFTVGLPLHVLDEEESLRPRLVAAVGAALDRMSAEHRRIEDALQALVPTWEELRARPGARLRDEALVRAARDLEALLEAHLVAEEREIFPALGRLPAALRTTIREELRARRR